MRVIPHLGESVRFRTFSVILTCSPSFTASLEGSAAGGRGHPSRRRAQARGPQDDDAIIQDDGAVYEVGAMVCFTSSANALSANGFGRKANCSSSRSTLL